MKKLLITSGCSFSECMSATIDTWPRHLVRELTDYEHKSYAMGSQGNGLISRGVIHSVVEALKTYKPEDILVGVMWSGFSRHDFRCNSSDELHFVQNKVHNGWIENPTQFVNDAHKNWVILNVNWADGVNNLEAETYYKMFYDDIGHSIYSIEHILRVQYFLQKHNIKYFFTDFSDYNLAHKDNIHHDEVNYLYNLIEREHYLPVSSEHRWCYENSKYHHLWPQGWEDMIWIHPNTEMHKEFVDQVIIPWLTEKKYI
jgi:hypothetical protein